MAREGRRLTSQNAPEPPAPRRTWRRSSKLLIGAAILVAALLLGLSGLGGSSKFLSVEEIVTAPQEHQGGPILVAGKVGSFSMADGTLRFVLVDNSDVNYTLQVRHTSELPAGFGGGRHIGVEGELVGSPGELLLESSRIQMGCSNSYT